jgi:hypothetical protein
MTMAVDFANGVFYRPILDPALGYGGTRYFPLHFVIHGCLIKLGLGPVAAGHTIGIAAMAGLIVGTYLLLRNLGVSRGLAVPSATLVLASTSAQLALSGIRGDSLPAALCVLGLAACATQKPRIVLAAVLFTLAFAAKITAVYGAAAAVLSLALAGRRRESALLAALATTGIVMVLATMHVASEGRVFEVFRACLFGGGSLMNFAKGPCRIALTSVQDDSPGLPFLIFGIAAVVSTLAVSWRELPSMILLAVAGVLAVVFGSPGTGENQLIDLHAAAVVAVVYAVSRSRVPVLFGTAALALAALAACADVVIQIAKYDVQVHRAQWDETLRAVEDVSGPLLSEHPLLPILAGERPYMLDPFMLRVTRERDSRVTTDLWRNLETRKFGAVILLTSIFGDRRHFGPGFHSKLAENYELVRDDLGFRIYRPRPNGGTR